MHPQAPITMLMVVATKDRRPDRPRGHDGRQGAEWWGGNQGSLACMERNTCRAVNGRGQQRRAAFELPLLTLNEFQSVCLWPLDTGLWRKAKNSAPEWNIPHQSWRDPLPIIGHSSSNVSLTPSTT